ncbi:hypothetical protein ACE1B6_02700 [Aerosakkonemataceae cyanobacterium BLCC-F154]|uniref:Uncharacterized protein n=1 Tax=Floridaenema fluviatile BLCC-F154 TaxID=3153640 RepID=A0ABV4Y5S6_9CYAN
MMLDGSDRTSQIKANRSRKAIALFIPRSIGVALKVYHNHYYNV